MYCCHSFVKHVYMFVWMHSVLRYILLFSEGNTDEIPTESIPIQYLPPIILSFKLPSNYPSKEMPEYQISCPWLTYAKVSIFNYE